MEPTAEAAAWLTVSVIYRDSGGCHGQWSKPEAAPGAAQPCEGSLVAGRGFE